MNNAQRSHSCEIITKERVSAAGWRFVLAAPEVAAQASPGQFVHILTDGKPLRRPISLCGFSPGHGTVTIVFEARGEGTAWLAERRRGEKLDLLGPLGWGFIPPRGEGKIIIVGGGIGTPPLLPLAGLYGGRAVVLLGFRSKDFVILEDDFAATGAAVRVSTDDGSYGRKGFITGPLGEELALGGVSQIYACGALPMLRLVASAADAAGVPCQISMEERMGCGIGACLVCACKTRSGGGEEYRHVCKDGPVFDSAEVVFE